MWEIGERKACKTKMIRCGDYRERREGQTCRWAAAFLLLST
jgi:hypothetical protein